MIGRRRTVAALDYPYEVGVTGAPGTFRARGLRASGKVGGWNRGVFLINDEPDASLPARFLFARARERTVSDREDPQSWTITAFVYVAEGTSTPAEVRRDVASTGSAHALAEVEIVADAPRALALQARVDRAHAMAQERTPWLVDPAYDGDYADALWAEDPNGRFGTFPVNILARAFPPYLHMFAALEPPPGWPEASLYLARPLEPDADVASLRTTPHAFELFPVAIGEDEKAVSDQAVRGVRPALCTVRVGSKTAIESEQQQ